MKPAISENPSAASADTKARIAAGTSPLTSRLIAVARPSLSCTSGAPAATIAVLTLPLNAEFLSSIAIVSPVRSGTDLMFGRAIRRATRRSVSLAEAGFSVLPRANVSGRLELSRFFALIPGAGATVATVIRSASARAAATCASIILVLKLVRPTVGCGSAMFARAVLDSVATALPAGCSRVFGELCGSGTRDAGGAAFAVILVGFAVLLARRAPWRA